jgi:AraC family transcriptional regulator of adaptative response / DNA-3-methyladenine glycosylase II
MAYVIEDQDRCYRAVVSRDKRFDGVFYTGVLTTGIYCRPSCPAVTPKRRNVRFFVSAAAAQAAGLRACKRCRPDTTPGSPEWDVRADVAGRAMRLINDGVVERAGVSGLAARLGYSERQLHRVLVAELGAGPLALARARRAHTARILAETTAMPLTDVAFAAGFASVRQFNATMRETYAVTPSALRGRTTPRAATGDVELRLAVREPFDGAALLDFLRVRAVPGVEEVTGETYRRTLRLPGGPGVVALTPGPSYVRCVLRLHDLADLPVAVERCRRLLDLDADPLAVADALGADPVLGPLVAKRPGLRVPGAVDGAEIAVRAVLGQQVSVAAARTAAGRLTAAYGTPLASPDGTLTHLFPVPDALAGADVPGPAKRAAALRGLCAALADGALDLDRGTDRTAAYDALVALPGIGPWTASYVALRALGDPDAFLPTDLGVRRALAALGTDVGAAEAWRPWRSYALLHLWTSLGENA